MLVNGILSLQAWVLPIRGTLIISKSGQRRLSSIRVQWAECQGHELSGCGQVEI